MSLYDDLGSPYKLNLSTRGFSVGPTVGLPPGVSVFLDGIRQNEPDAQEVTSTSSRWSTSTGSSSSAARRRSSAPTRSAAR